MHERKIGNIFGFTGGNYAGNVYDHNYLAPTLNTMQGGCKQPLIIDEVKQLGFMDNGTGKHQSNTVYDENAVCPNITTIEGGGTQQIKVLTDVKAVRMVRTEEGKALRKQYENHELHHGFNEHREMELRKDGVGLLREALSEIQKVWEPTNYQEMQRCSYRIRKLTPKECWRLMDFSDEDFEKAAEVNSNTQLYKQAGNSIIRNVLVAILGQLIEGKEDAYRKV